jgi:hypothetical protein
MYTESQAKWNVILNGSAYRYKEGAADHRSLCWLLYKSNIAYFVSVGSEENFTARSLSVSFK